MTQLETDFSLTLYKRRVARAGGKIDVNVAMLFLGALLRANPQSLDGLTLTDQHIVLAHSEPNNRSTYGELGELFEESPWGIRKQYQRGVVRLWNDAPAALQQTYPLESIFDAVRVVSLKTRRERGKAYAGRQHTQEEKVKIGEGVRESFKDPEVKRKLIEGRKGRRHAPEVKAKIGRANKGRKRSTEARLRMGKSQTKRYAKPEERKKTSEAKIRSYIRKDNKRTSDEDSKLWSYAINNNLIGAIIDGGLLTEAEVDLLRSFFEEDRVPKNLSGLLNKLSIGIARLA
ncbi:MAG: hypothetical protein HYT06_01865 [Candidatus Levybacteria bacterium]|nr:hypothetical protein [Candidatus Levybacteria bacterium]